mgnify:CR=1 FL=1
MTTAGFEPVHGTDGIAPGGRGIIRNCWFGKTQGYNDSIDFTGGTATGRLIAGGEGRRVIRPMFAGQNPAPTEQAMRHRLRRDGLWFR